MKNRYNPQAILAILQLIIIITAKFWFLRAGSNNDATAFSWMYYPMSWILSQILSIWSGSPGSDLAVSYSGFVCNFDFRFASGSASLNGCSAGGLFLAVLGLSGAIALLWQRSRFAAQKTQQVRSNDQGHESGASKSARWGFALLGLLFSYLFSFTVLLLYNLYVIFGSASLATKLVVLQLKYPWIHHFPYIAIVKLLFVLCAALLFALLCRKKS